MRKKNFFFFLLCLFALLQSACTSISDRTPSSKMSFSCKELTQILISSNEAYRYVYLFGLNLSEADRLIINVNHLLPQESERVLSLLEMIGHGIPLYEEDATFLSQVLIKIESDPFVMFSMANDIDLIWGSKRFWGMTEGAVYGRKMPSLSFKERLKAMISKKEGMVVFQGQAASLFSPHPVEGVWSFLKKFAGQHQAGFGDIVFDEAYRDGNYIVVTKAHIATKKEGRHQGQKTLTAYTRKWGRRLIIEPLALGSLVTGTYSFHKFVVADIKESLIDKDE